MMWTSCPKATSRNYSLGRNIFPQSAHSPFYNINANLTSPQNFGKFSVTTGYSFSNWNGTNGTPQGVLRIAF